LSASNERIYRHAGCIRSLDNKVSCREDELTGAIDQTVEIVTAAAAAIDD
jgi:hypothetical protein